MFLTVPKQISMTDSFSSHSALKVDNSKKKLEKIIFKLSQENKNIKIELDSLIAKVTPEIKTLKEIIESLTQKNNLLESNLKELNQRIEELVKETFIQKQELEKLSEMSLDGFVLIKK